MTSNGCHPAIESIRDGPEEASHFVGCGVKGEPFVACNKCMHSEN